MEVELNPAQQALVVSIIDAMKVLFGPRGIESPKGGLFMISDVEGQCIVLQCCSCNTGHHFAA